MRNVTSVELPLLNSYVSAALIFLCLKPNFGHGETRNRRHHLSLEPLDGSGSTRL